MKTPILVTLLLATALAAGAAPLLAADGEVSIEAGDRVIGDLASGDVDRVRFHAVDGTRLDLTLRVDGAMPTVNLEEPSGDDASNLPWKSTGAVRRLKGLVLSDSGDHAIRLEGTGDADYSIEMALRLPRSVSDRDDIDDVGFAVLDLGDLPAGVTLRIIATGGVIEEVTDPSGSLDIPSGRRRVDVRVVATGPVKVTVSGREDRRVKVRALVRAVKRAGTEREVVDGSGEPGGGGGGGGDDKDERVAGFVVVRLRDGAEESDFEDRHGTTVVEAVEGTSFFVLEVPEGDDDDDFLSELDVDDDCVENEPLLVSESPEGGQSSVAFTSSESARADVVAQPGFQTVRASAAAAVASGAGVVVAVLDTGVDADHPDLVGRLEPGIDLIDGDLVPDDEADGLDNDGDGLFDEGVGHGTFVAGLIATLAPQVRILPVRVLNSDARGSTAVVARGIVFAVDAGASVINLSLGLRRNSALLQDALSYAKERDVLVVASAGNRGNTGVVDFPANTSEVLSVSAVGAGNVRPAFANAASKVDLVAPGVDILAPHRIGNYARWSGTSFAAPFATAGAAMVLSRNPGIEPRKAGDLLEDTAVSVDAQNPGLAGTLGSGRIDLLNAVQEKP
jgi:subtilisin family serine protease